MFLRLAAIVAVLLAFPATALAGGGNYGFDGATPAERTTVRSALDASSFNWNVVSQRVTIHVGPVGTSSSTPGHVWLDRGLLATGRFSWATVMDEYAHQVDFLVLDSATRAIVQQRLGASAWCYEVAGLAHGAYGCERFSSMLAWAYWPSKHSSYRPLSSRDESATMSAGAFRQLLDTLLGAPSPLKRHP